VYWGEDCVLAGIVEDCVLAGIGALATTLGTGCGTTTAKTVTTTRVNILSWERL
jgi:hypothetical protein